MELFMTANMFELGDVVGGEGIVTKQMSVDLAYV
jgi:hypothetical protein